MSKLIKQIYAKTVSINIISRSEKLNKLIINNNENFPAKI